MPFTILEWGKLQRTDSGLYDNQLLINDLYVLVGLIYVSQKP